MELNRPFCTLAEVIVKRNGKDPQRGKHIPASVQMPFTQQCFSIEREEIMKNDKGTMSSSFFWQHENLVLRFRKALGGCLVSPPHFTHEETRIKKLIDFCKVSQQLRIR